MCFAPPQEGRLGGGTPIPQFAAMTPIAKSFDPCYFITVVISGIGIVIDSCALKSISTTAALRVASDSER